MKKGKLIVIDGTDGSGKATQAKVLVSRLRKSGKKVKTIDFPGYARNFFGKMIGECLVGDYGDWTKVDPHLASVIYAADRWESSKMVNNWLKKGFCVVADRYVSSNQIHQGGKVLQPKKRREFLEWLDKMEFEVFRIPRPDRIIYLDVPLDFSQRLIAKEGGKKKVYQKGKKDLHENNQKHLLDAKKSALKMVRERNNWTRIDCTKKGRLLSIEEIGELVWREVNK